MQFMYRCNILQIFSTLYQKWADNIFLIWKFMEIIKNILTLKKWEKSVEEVLIKVDKHILIELVKWVDLMNIWLVYFGYLFNGISIFVGNLFVMPKP